MPPRESISASSGRSIHNPSPAIRITARQPSLPVRKPVSGIASMEPAPIQSSNRPSEPSSIPMRVLAKGTSGACAAMPRPATKRPCGWRSVEERRAFAVHCTRWLSCKRQDLGSKEWRKLLTVLSQSAIRVEKIRVWFLSGTASAHQPQGDRPTIYAFCRWSSAISCGMPCHFSVQPRQQVAVACWATNTGWPRIGVCLPSF